MKSTIVIGHKNPDTDSICSAICYAYLKHRMTGEEYVPCRAGDINGETKYVLDKFSVPAPQLLESLEPTVADVPFRRIEGIDAPLSLKRAWEHMRDENIQTVPILTKRGKIKGILTLGDQARFYMEDQDASALSKAKTPYSNIADTLQGEIVTGNPDGKFTKDKRSERNQSISPLEATHFGDCVDKLIWTKYGKLIQKNTSFVDVRI